MNTFLQQLSQFFSSQSLARRLVLLLIVVASLGGLAAIAMRAKTGTYRTIYSNLTLADAADASSRLRQIDIPVRFAEGGSALQVPTRFWDQALIVLAQDGFPSSGNIGYELMDKSSIGLSDFEQKVRYHRSLEGELSRTIMAIDGIERAKVHLALPKPSLFVSEQAEPTASVVLKVRGGRTLEPNEVKGIARLVASAVEKMNPEDVSIVDSQGNMLNQGLDPNEETLALSNRLAYKVEYENRLKERIESMLAKTVGDGKVVARVNADFDFAQRSMTQETYDPDGQVVRQEKWYGEGPAAGGSGAGSAGPAGSDSNLPPGDPGATTVGALGADANAKTDRATFYEISRTTQQIVETVPILERITVSVLVDGSYVEVETPEGELTQEFRPLPESEIAVLTDAVRNIIGYSEDREGGTADSVTVSSVPFRVNEVELEETPLVERLLTPHLIREIIQWSIVGLIGLLLILMVLRPAVRSVAIVGSGGTTQGLPGPQSGDRASISGAGRMLASGAGQQQARLSGQGAPAGLPGGPTATGAQGAQAALGTQSAFAGAPAGADAGAAFLNSPHLHAVRQANEAEAAIAQAAQSNIPKAAAIVRSWLDER